MRRGLLFWLVAMCLPAAANPPPASCVFDHTILPALEEAAALLPRYFPKPGAIDAEALALDGEGKPVPGLPVTVRLIHRQWNSILQASDFAQGAAKYETQVLDEVVTERRFAAGTDAEKLHFAVRDAGVYVVEVEAADKAGRTQKVREDLFMAGDTPVTWSRPLSQTISITADGVIARVVEGAGGAGRATIETRNFKIEGAAQQVAQAAAHLAIVQPPTGTHVWRNPELPAGLNRLALRATVTQAVPQVTWLVDGVAAATVAPDKPFLWPMLPGRHRFQVRLPLAPEVSAPVALTVD